EENPYGDRRMLLSTGPFDFAKGEIKTLDVAAIWKALPTGSYPCPSFDSLKVTADCVQSNFDGQVFTSAPEIITQESFIGIFPNPSSQIIAINHQGIKIDQVVFRNSLGQSVKKISLTNENKIDVSQLPKGVYFVEFLDHGFKKGTKPLII